MVGTFFRFFYIFLCLLVSFQLYAQTTEEGPNKIKSVLKQHFPDLTIDEVTASPIKGLYQIVAGSTVVYATGDGRYVFNGDIIDLEKNQHNITETFRKTVRLKGLKTIGQENMIVFPAKDPKYTVTVFTDVDCGYCRKMQSEISKINDLGITIQYLAFPRAGPSTPTYEKMISIWCAKDRNQALTLAFQNKHIETNLCTNNGVIKEFQYGLSMGVVGTPTIVFADGTLVPGYLPPEKLLEVAEQLSQQKKN